MTIISKCPKKIGLLPRNSVALQIPRNVAMNTKKELLVVTSQGDWTIAIQNNEEPEKIVIRVRDYGVICGNGKRIPPCDIQKIIIRPRIKTVPKKENFQIETD